MPGGVPTKVVSSCLGLSGFAVAIVAGLAANNPVDDTLTRAIVSMGALYLVGQGLGALAERAVDERLAQHQKERPLKGAKQQVEDEPPFLTV